MTTKNILREKNGKFREFLDFSELESDPYIEKWLDNIKSKQQRLSLMQTFCNFIEKTPMGLAEEHNIDIQKDPLNKTHIAKKQLNAFFGYLTNTDDENWKNTLNNKKIKKPIAWNSARQYVYSKLLSFYSRLNIPLNFKKREKPEELDININEKTWRDNGELITTESKKNYLKQIRDGFNNILDRTILLCEMSSSLDSVDLFNLKVRDFNRGFMKAYNICYLQGNRQKDGELYQTFFSSEACDCLDVYFKDRERKGETITDNSWLFVVKKKNGKHYTKMQGRYFSEDLKEVCNKLGLENITPKSLRRWFSSTLERNSINKGIIKRFMGQKTDVQDTHYNMMLEQAKEGETDELAKFYYEKIDGLVSLGNGNHIIREVDKKIEQLEKLNNDLIEQLASTNKGLETRDREIAEILKGMKPFLGIEYERLVEDHRHYSDERTSERGREEYKELETDFQDLKKVMSKIDEFVKKHQEKK